MSPLQQQFSNHICSLAPRHMITIQVLGKMKILTVYFFSSKLQTLTLFCNIRCASLLAIVSCLEVFDGLAGPCFNSSKCHSFNVKPCHLVVGWVISLFKYSSTFHWQKLWHMYYFSAAVISWLDHMTSVVLSVWWP